MNVIINLTVGILSPCIHISSQCRLSIELKRSEEIECSRTSRGRSCSFTLLAAGWPLTQLWLWTWREWCVSSGTRASRDHVVSVFALLESSSDCPMKGSWLSLLKEARPHKGERICPSQQAGKLPDMWVRPSQLFQSRGPTSWIVPRVKTQVINSHLLHGHAHTWEGIHTLSWHAGVCEVVFPSHPQFFLRLFLLTACCIQRPYTSPPPSTQLGTPSMRATGGVTWHLHYVWGFQLPHNFSQSCCPLKVIRMV